LGKKELLGGEKAFSKDGGERGKKISPKNKESKGNASKILLTSTEQQTRKN